MEFSLSNLMKTNTTILSPPPTNATTKQPLVRLQKLGMGPTASRGVVMGCCAGKKQQEIRPCLALGVELERELEEIEREGISWREMENCRGRVMGGGKGSKVELLECLEREAIMGDDEGREPTDYNRRAQIFDKSSKVFQALKEMSTTQTES